MARRESDHGLVRACLGGDCGAWERLLRRYRRLIYSIPHAFGLAPDAADEIFQNVSIKLVQHLARLRKAESLASWLAVTARHECQHYARRQGRYRDLDHAEPEQLVEPTPEIAGRLHRVECEHALALAFERLDGTCRALLEALYLEEPRPSYQEIGRRLDRPVGSLGPTRSRCLAKLRRLYAGEGGPPP